MTVADAGDGADIVDCHVIVARNHRRTWPRHFHVINLIRRSFLFFVSLLLYRSFVCIETKSSLFEYYKIVYISRSLVTMASDWRYALFVVVIVINVFFFVSMQKVGDFRAHLSVREKSAIFNSLVVANVLLKTTQNDSTVCVFRDALLRVDSTCCRTFATSLLSSLSFVVNFLFAIDCVVFACFCDIMRRVSVMRCSNHDDDNNNNK